MLKYIFLVCSLLIISKSQNDLQGFDDSVLFDIQWPGKDFEFDDKENDFVIFTSSHNEKYKCLFPAVVQQETSRNLKYDGPTALELIAPLFSKPTCSYRLETYWTYEVCHGRSIRQYHEDREGKKVKLQEYLLGKWDNRNYEKQLASIKEEEKDENFEIPVKKIDNMLLPYLEVVMENGTSCDLSQKPRLTRVLYVCFQHGKNEVFSLKETSTCQYEVIILTPLLCSHPKYKPKESEEKKINCIPLDGSDSKPYNLRKMKVDSAKLRKNPDFDGFRVEVVQLEKSESPAPPKFVPTAESEKPSDLTPVKNFLSGKNCLNGGSGWWKYEFCYGKHVKQYHVDKNQEVTSITLGTFDLEKHLAWLEAHPHKRPKPLGQRKHLTHFYSDGTKCDKTGKLRQTEVKLKCAQDTSGVVSGVSLYLVEPRYCEYILGVESPLICDIIEKADENGLVDDDMDVPTINI